MATLDLQVGAGVDDNYYRQNSGGSPTLSDNANDVPIGLFGANETALGGQMRFTNVTIPQGATIDTAYLTLKSSGSDSGTTANSRVRGKNVDNATIDTTTGGFEAPPFTTAVVDWDSIAAWTEGTNYNSPEIKTVIQEIVNRAGWASGNAMVIQWDDMEKRSTQVSALRRGRSYNNVAADAPKLHIEYTVAAATKTISTSLMMGV